MLVKVGDRLINLAAIAFVEKRRSETDGYFYVVHFASSVEMTMTSSESADFDRALASIQSAAILGASRLLNQRQMN